MLTSSRRGISYPNTDRSDRPDLPAHFNNFITALDVDVLYIQGTNATRLARAHQSGGGLFFWATDTSLLWYDDGTTWQQVTPAPTASVPTGSVTQYAGSSSPSGWLLCDGTAVSRTTYASLFAVTSTSYGVGDGSSTFNVPDYRGRMPVGLGTHADVATLGNSDGAALASRRPKHLHTVVQPSISTPTISKPNVNIADPGHVHSQDVNTVIAGPAGSGSTSGTIGGRTGTTQSNSTGITASLASTPTSSTPIASGGTVGPQTTSPTDTPAYLTINFIIKT